jgi:hypothetical protein
MNKVLSPLTLSFIVLMPAILHAETITKRVDLDGIKHIHMYGSFDLNVSQGGSDFVVLTADSEVLDKIEAKVQGSKLALGRSEDSWNLFSGDREPVRASFELQVRELKSVSNFGAGSVEINNINTDEDLSISNMGAGHYLIQSIRVEDVEFHNFGAGHIEVSELKAKDIKENSFGAGKLEYNNVSAEKWKIISYGNSRSVVADSQADEVEISIRGSGEVDAAGLRTNKAEIDIEGAGVVRIHVVEELEVDISGSGKIFYSGQPEIDKEISGSGELVPMNR